MNFVVVGTNHQYSPIELRERLAFSPKRLKEALFFLKERKVLKGAVILSTCNRVEIYSSTEDLNRAREEIEDFISRYHEIERRKIRPYFFRYPDEQALRHLLLVACGLDSLILGETQILAQLKHAFSEAENAGFVDNLLRDAFYFAISIAKKIHAETKISEGKVSVGSVAIDFIKGKIGALLGKNILIIGVGKVTELVLKYLSKEGPNVIFVSNRTFLRAKELAAQIGAKAVRFDDLRHFLKEADVVISATASPHFIIKKETLKNRPNRRLLIIDLAVPRDVQPEVKEIKGVELFCLEDLTMVIRHNEARKIQEAERIKVIINKETERLWKRLTRLAPEPVLSL